MLELTDPLPPAAPESLGLDPGRLEALDRLVGHHLEEGRYPGCQVAVARRGQLGFFKTYGNARLTPSPQPATERTLWAMFSITKVLVGMTLWTLVEEGRLSFADKVVDYIPEFGTKGKEKITVAHLMRHEGGFPTADVSQAAWTDHDLLRREVCDFEPEWEAGTHVRYHGLAGHWVLAVLLESISGRDYREVVKARVIAPLGLEAELYLGLPDGEVDRVAEESFRRDMPKDNYFVMRVNTLEWQRAGVPGAGGLATARALAAVFQVVANGGRLGDRRLVSKRLLEHVARTHTGDDESILANRGFSQRWALGISVRSTGAYTPEAGSLASPTTMGHSGGNQAVAWGDPESGVSFAFMSNEFAPPGWDGERMEKINNIVHAAIETVS